MTGKANNQRSEFRFGVGDNEVADVDAADRPNRDFFRPAHPAPQAKENRRGCYVAQRDVATEFQPDGFVSLSIHRIVRIALRPFAQRRLRTIARTTTAQAVRTVAGTRFGAWAGAAPGQAFGSVNSARAKN